MPDPNPPQHDPAPDSASSLAISIPGYQLLNLIGRGGQGSVYKAVDQASGKTVAIKVLHGGPFADQSSRQRLQREIAALREIDHPNIVHVVAHGQSPTGHDYLIMNYVEGRTLAEFWQDLHYNPIHVEAHDDLLRVFIQACHAVGAAHARGIIHRDLSPANIRIDAASQPHVLDFGLARPALDAQAASGSPKLTITGQFLGSLAYASPEQVRSSPEAISVRTDVYALGVMLYQIATGGLLPYAVTGDLSRNIHNILHAEPATPGSRCKPARARLPLDRVVLKALKKDPALRHGSATELARDLEHCLAHDTDPARRSPQRSAGAVVLLGLIAALAAYGLRPILHGKTALRAYSVPNATTASTHQSQLGSKTQIDLLKLVDPARDMLQRGDWAFRDGALISHATGGNELELPYAAPLEYDYRIRLVFPRDDDAMLMMFFPAGMHQIAWAIGDRANRACGFDLVDGKDVSQNLTTRWAKKWLFAGRHHTAQVKVRRASVEGYLDDVLVCRYETDYHEIGLRTWMNFKRPDTVGLMVNMSGVKVEEARLIEITGKGKPAR